MRIKLIDESVVETIDPVKDKHVKSNGGTIIAIVVILIVVILVIVISFISYGKKKES